VASPGGCASRQRESQLLGGTFFLAPLLALISIRLPREREAGVRGDWLGPTAKVDAPAPLSSVLVLGLHGYRWNDSSTYPGDGVA
jgi:hypothetical protein